MSESTVDAATTDPATTGDPRVDAVVSRLDELDRVDLSDRLAMFTDMQAALAEVLDGDAGVTSTPS